MKVLVIGANGKMGQAIVKNMRRSSLVPHVGLCRDKIANGFLNTANDLSQVKESAIDLVIDFSSPSAFRQAAHFCMKNKIPMISGTTGLNKSDFNLLRKTAKKTPVLWAPNMSLGVAILRKSLNVLKGAKGFSISIEETHHTKKKDSPSGTAIRLQDDIKKITGKKVSIKAFRKGKVVGTHRIFVKSKMEILEFSHIATDRNVFAVGAIKAGEWIVRKKPAMYTMDDVLG